MILNKKLRKNLIKERQNNNLTQVELAKQLEISVRHYKSLEAGTSNGSVEIWYKLKKIFEVETIDYLLEQEVETLQEQDTMKADKPQDG